MFLLQISIFPMIIVLSFRDRHCTGRSRLTIYCGGFLSKATHFEKPNMSLTKRKPEVPVGEFLFGKECEDEVRDRNFLIEADTGLSITFGEFYSQSEQLASAMLKKLNIEAEDVVAHFGNSSIQYGLSISACWMLGVTYTPVIPGNDALELRDQLAKMGVKFLFISKEKLLQTSRLFEDPTVWKQVRVVVFDVTAHSDQDSTFNSIMERNNFDTFEQLTQGSKGKLEQFPHFSVKMDSVMVIARTSGTTGLPKGACHTNLSMLTNATHLASHPPIHEHRNQPMLLSFGFGHVSGTVMIMVCFLNRTTAVLLNQNSFARLYEIIEKYGIFQAYGSYGLVTRLVQFDQCRNDISSLKVVLSTGMNLGDELPKTLHDRNIQVVNAYGATEMLYVSATCGKTFPTSVGRLLDCYEVKVLDIDTGEVLPKGQTGELCFRGDCRLKEYLHNPEATAKAIDHEGYFHSGDMGHLDENDNLHLTGRIKEIIKFQEFTVFPSDVESILASHDAVEATTVLRVRHTRYNEVARAFVKLKPNHNNVTVEELRKFCKEKCGFKRQPHGGIILVDELKLTPMAKVDRVFYRQLCANVTLDHEIPRE